MCERKQSLVERIVDVISRGSIPVDGGYWVDSKVPWRGAVRRGKPHRGRTGRRPLGGAPGSGQPRLLGGGLPRRRCCSPDFDGRGSNQCRNQTQEKDSFHGVFL